VAAGTGRQRHKITGLARAAQPVSPTGRLRGGKAGAMAACKLWTQVGYHDRYRAMESAYPAGEGGVEDKTDTKQRVSSEGGNKDWQIMWNAKRNHIEGFRIVSRYILEVGGRLKQYKHEILGFLFGVALLNLWYLSGIAVEERVLPKYYDYVVNIITVTISTALGAYLAFRYNASLEEQKRSIQLNEEKLKEVAKLNRALFNLGRQLNSIGNMKNHLAKFENDYELAFKMRVEKNFDSTPLVDFDELTLILPEQLHLLLIIDNEQAGFQTTIESFHVRSDFFLSRLQPEMAALGLLDRKVPVVELQAKLSYGTYKGAMDAAMTLKHNIISTGEGLEKAFKDLRNACREKYPEHKFINIE